MPDLISLARKIDNFLRQLVMSVRQDKNLCHVEDEGGSTAPSGDVNPNAASPPDFSIEQGTARSTSRCAMFESKVISNRVIQ
jgi:hypothetical protein